MRSTVTKGRRPPGPAQSASLGTLFTSPAGRLARFQSLVREYGDIASLRIGRQQVVFINHPDLVREVLVTQSRNFTKGRGK